MGWLLYSAWVLLVLGIVLVVLVRRGRKRRGLGPEETLSLDDVEIYSPRLGLIGRPDRIMREGERLIPEEWKFSKRLNHGHRLQLGTYFILIEDQYRVRPPHGFIVLGDGSRHQVENTAELRAEVLAVAREIRKHRRNLREEIPVRQPAWKCRVCGQRENCRRRSD